MNPFLLFQGHQRICSPRWPPWPELRKVWAWCVSTTEFFASLIFLWADRIKSMICRYPTHFNISHCWLRTAWKVSFSSVFAWGAVSMFSQNPPTPFYLRSSIPFGRPNFVSTPWFSTRLRRDFALKVPAAIMSSLLWEPRRSNSWPRRAEFSLRCSGLRWVRTRLLFHEYSMSPWISELKCRKLVQFLCGKEASVGFRFHSVFPA
jgi:hypothetical protein